MNFAELQRGIFDDWQYQAEPKVGVQDRVRRYLNEGLERTLRRPRLKSLLIGTWQFTSIAGDGFLGLPVIFDRIDYIIDLTNGRRLRFRSRDWYRNLDPSLKTSGTPSVWIAEGVAAARYESDRGADANYTITIRSTSDTDITQRARIRVLIPRGYELEGSTIMQGQTPLAFFVDNQPLPPIKDKYQITHLSIDATCAGTVTIADGGTNHTTNPLAEIFPGATASAYTGVRLYPPPSAALLYEVEGQRAVPKLRYDGDVPPFPAAYHEMLQSYARARMYRKEGRLQQSREEMAEYERFALDLTAHVEYPPTYRPVAGKLSAEGSRWSDLGPNYPADRFGVISD